MAIITFHTILPTDKELIEQIAEWYFDEWNIPKERTISRLQDHPNDDILFQLVLKENDIPVTTGGLYNNVGLHLAYPEFKAMKPWVALLYTHPDFRNKGYGKKLLQQIETTAASLNINKLFLYTFTAEMLYKKSGWKEINRVNYHDHDTSIMQIEIKR